jgi:hypothetical protein
MYYVYHIDTTRFAYTTVSGGKMFKTEGAAKAARTRYANAVEGVEVEDLGIAEVNDFHANIEKQVTRTNLRSGNEFQEPVNTPHYCSPAFESYWSM